MLTASSASLLRHTISALQQEFSMKDLGPLHHFLGISVERKSNGLFLAQKQYTLDIIQRAGMVDCKPCSTPVDTHAKLSAADGAQVIRPQRSTCTSSTIACTVLHGLWEWKPLLLPHQAASAELAGMLGMWEAPHHLMGHEAC